MKILWKDFLSDHIVGIFGVILFSISFYCFSIFFDFAMTKNPESSMALRTFFLYLFSFLLSCFVILAYVLMEEPLQSFANSIQSTFKRYVVTKKEAEKIKMVKEYDSIDSKITRLKLECKQITLEKETLLKELNKMKEDLNSAKLKKVISNEFSVK